MIAANVPVVIPVFFSKCRADVGERVEVGQLEEEHDGERGEHLPVESADR